MGAYEQMIFDEGEEEGGSSQLKRYIIGCMLWAAGTIMKAFSLALSQMLDGILGEFELNVGRFTSMLILIIPILLKQQPYMMIAKKNTIPTLLLCLVLFGLNYANYAATIYIPSGTANIAFIISYLVLTLLISTIKTYCTESKLNCSALMWDSGTILMLTVGLIFVVQPEAMFGFKPHTKYKSFCNPLRFGAHNLTLSTNNSGNTSVFLSTMEPMPDNNGYTFKYSILGYFYALGAGVLNTMSIFLGQYIFKTEPPIVVCTWISVINSLLSIIATVLFESFVFPSGIFCQIVFAFHAMFTGFMTVLCLLAIQYVPSIDLSVIGSLSVAIVFGFQFSVLKNASPSYTTTNTTAIIAAVFISLVSILKPLTECIRLRKAKSEMSNYRPI